MSDDEEQAAGKFAGLFGPHIAAPADVLPSQEGDAPVKRGRGRPRKDGLPPGSGPSRTPRRKLPSPAVIKGGISKALTAGNGLFVKYAVIQPMDALTEMEILLLTDGLAAEVDQSKRLQDLLSKANAVSPHAKLAYAVGMIVYARLAIHGVIPMPRPDGMPDLNYPPPAATPEPANVPWTAAV